MAKYNQEFKRQAVQLIQEEPNQVWMADIMDPVYTKDCRLAQWING